MNRRPSRNNRNPWILRGQRLLGMALLPGVAVLAVTLGWWISRPTTARSAHSSGPAYPRAKGPVPSAICGTSGVPRPPPAMDSPIGRHLYANTSNGVVHPLPAMAIADTLMPPPNMVRGSSSTANRQQSVATGQGPGATATTKSSDADAATASVGGGHPSNANSTVPKNETAQDDVAAVGQLLEEYRRVFGAMPVGELNDEIVRRLQGDNPLGIAVLPKDHPAINANGELVDRWGNPYRFHPESAWIMTVRSAGPDGRMWTSDDIITSEGQPPKAEMLFTGTGGGQ